MKKMIAILLSLILGTTLFVGCGDKKEAIKEPQKQEQKSNDDNTQQNKEESDKVVKIVNLKDIENYRYLKQLVKSNIVKFNEETSQKGTKNIDVEIQVKNGTDQEIVKNFFDDIIQVSGFLDSTYKGADFDILTVRDKKIGLVMYMHDKDKGGLLTLESVIMEPKYQKIFDKLKEEFLKEN